MADKNVKKRNWAFVLYPESAPKDWIDQLQQTGLQCAISPLHDRDVDPTGEPKKAHFHVILCYNGPTSYGVVKALTNGKLGQTIPQPLEQVRGYYRYLTHEDNPDKVQYSKADIQTLNGFDIRDYVELTKSEISKYKRQLIEYIQENDIVEYSDLIDITMTDSVPQEWFDIASSNTLFFTAVLKSRRFGGAENGGKQKAERI